MVPRFIAYVSDIVCGRSEIGLDCDGPTWSLGCYMARRRVLHTSKLAALESNEPPDLALTALEEYEPPELTPERLSDLARRRAEVAGSGVPTGLARTSSARVRAAIEAAALLAAAPDVAITYDVARRTWRLLDDYAYAYQGTTLTAKKGYAFDLSSIPRPLWWLIAPNELSILAPLFHDLLYEYRGKLPDPTYANPYRTYTRREADDLFLHLMEVEGVASWRRLAAYSAVRAAGEIYWRT